MGTEIVIAGLSALSGAAGAITAIHTVYSSNQEKVNRRFETLENDVKNFKNDVFHDYVLKEDFLREMQAVHTKLDRILDYLIQTANK